MSEKQLTQARNVVAVGKQRGETATVIKANLYAEATESHFLNYANSTVPESLKYPHDAVGSDNDSLGPNQIRVSTLPTAGIAKLMDPIFQINWFYDTAKAKNPTGYQSMEPAALAQLVEVSGPNAYAQSRLLGDALYDKFKDVDVSALASSVTDAATAAANNAATTITSQCSGNTSSGPSFTPGGPFGQNVIAAAMRWLGTPYSWGGGNQNGPTFGISDNGGAGDAHGDTTHKGFDCSGLTLYAVYQASGGKILLQHYTGDHGNPGQLYDPRGQTIPFDQKQPGDEIYFGSGGNTSHVGIYYGKQNGQDMLLNAPESGKTVSIMPLSGWNGEEMYVRRFG
ncbi:MAG: C40 family peptidase [Gordonia polyisoprenivorans]|nr:C40 family peptidase [Gordonia polyisoprenivorans]